MVVHAASLLGTKLERVKGRLVARDTLNLRDWLIISASLVYTSLLVIKFVEHPASSNAVDFALKLSYVALLVSGILLAVLSFPGTRLEGEPSPDDIEYELERLRKTAMQRVNYGMVIALKCEEAEEAASDRQADESVTGDA